ncbi:hypothetical protein [Haloferax mucosum]|uniref:hypothetical protein n=1 Tax=Haloferax mucosum TaxID=403181 RepID=UPI000320C25F|nr:hypothetical protein [Haloferax mucosum]
MSILRISGDDADGAGYTVDVDGDVAGYSGMGANDGLTDDGAAGYIGSGTDRWAVSGSITDIDIPDHARAYLDGKRIDLSRFRSSSSSSSSTGGGSSPPSPAPTTQSGGFGLVAVVAAAAAVVAAIIFGGD